MTDRQAIVIVAGMLRAAPHAPNERPYSLLEAVDEARKIHAITNARCDAAEVEKEQKV